MSISDSNLPLLRAGDKCYRIESRFMGNTTIRQRSIVTRTIHEIIGDVVHWKETTRTTSMHSLRREYTLFHPVPPARFMDTSKYWHEEEVKKASDLAAKQRADFAARRKAAKGSSKA